MSNLDMLFEVGEYREMPDYTAEIRAITSTGDPLEVAFIFERPLEDPLYRWFYWGDHGTEPWTPPAVGEQTFLAARDMTSFFPAAEG